MKKHLLAIPLIATGMLFGHEEETEAAELPKMEMKDIDFDKLSETFGHMMGKHLEMLGFDIKMNKVFQGIENALGGKDSPMTESECFQAMSVIQEENHKKKASENLAAAESFLKKNAKAKGIVCLEDKKLQYKVTQSGKGAVLEEGFAPKIRYKGTFLDGSVFGESQEEEHISLAETIEGFTKGLVGMKEGEKRTLYIHPDLAYKDAAGALPPNSLLTFEIELVKANEPIEKPEELTADSEDLPEDGEEIAFNDDESVE